MTAPVSRGDLVAPALGGVAFDCRRGFGHFQINSLDWELEADSLHPKSKY